MTEATLKPPEVRRPGEGDARTIRWKVEEKPEPIAQLVAAGRDESPSSSCHRGLAIRLDARVPLIAQ